MPAVFSKLLPTIASAYGLQIALAAIFVPLKNEKYYDLGGAAGFLSAAFVSLYGPSLRAKFWDGTLKTLPAITSFAPRQLILSAALGIWSIRLGSFLAQRAIKAGGDSRFDEIKQNPARFTFTWIMQATWITLVGLPVFLSATLPTALHPVLAARDFAAIGLCVGSFAWEVLADRQKSAWRKAKDAKQHDEQFVSSGLWSLSRHPNYVGEVGIWTGIWALSTSALQTPYFPRGAVALAAISPIFTWILVRHVSGVPLLEKSGDKKWADNTKYQHYKRTVPVFWPTGRKD